MGRDIKCGPVNFENIMLNEEKKAQKVTYYMIAFVWNIQNR